MQAMNRRNARKIVKKCSELNYKITTLREAYLSHSDLTYYPSDNWLRACAGRDQDVPWTKLAVHCKYCRGTVHIRNICQAVCMYCQVTPYLWDHYCETLYKVCEDCRKWLVFPYLKWKSKYA